MQRSLNSSTRVQRENLVPVPGNAEKVPFLVKVSISDLNIRKGLGTDYGRVQFCPVGVYTIVECVLSIENPQNRKENSPLSDREIPIIRKKHVESFRFFPYLVGKKAAFTAFCPIG